MNFRTQMSHLPPSYSFVLSVFHYDEYEKGKFVPPTEGEYGNT